MSDGDSATMALRRAEGILKALANRRRLRLLLALWAREMHVGALAEDLRLPLKAVSRHLRLLERAGLVLSEPHQGHVYYRVSSNKPPLAEGVLAKIDTNDPLRL